ncbi:caspase recruitment domain-containing protein 14 isoform X2 [Salminus brasiliensis]|uniref:caspase recruitment domain-containing protein 14 isoform X2 n=1 Tax=Salminus brasiliensis TaxID=930266 RepID=UPI003B8332C1
MAAESVEETPDLKDMDEEELWDLINDNRHAISLGVRPCMLIPYLRQARVLTDLDEDEILTCLKFNNRSMRTSHMLDILRVQGRNGAVALLDSLMIHYPNLYTQITGRKPSTEPSSFSGLIKYSELTEYLVRAVTGMQKELQGAREEAAQLRSRCSSLQGELSQAVTQGQEYTRLHAENTRLRTHLAGMHRDLLRLKDEKCDLYVRYAAAVEEKSAANIRCRDLNLQLYQLQCELRKAQTETDFQRQRSLRTVSFSKTQQLREELSILRRQLLEAEKITPACQDILAQDLEEARDRRSELAEQLRRLHEENDALTRERDELLEEKDVLALQVQKLSLDCEMYQQKSTVFQSQLGDLQTERDRAYLARDEAQAQIACGLAEKDTLRGQLVELQEKVFTLRSFSSQEEPDKSRERQYSWESGLGSSSDCPPCTPPPRPRLRRMDALPPACSSYQTSEDLSDDGFNSVRSSLVEPPGSESLRRREKDIEFSGNSQGMSEDSSICLLDIESDFVFIPKDEDEPKFAPSAPSPSSSFESSPCHSTSSCKSSPCQSTSSCKSSPCQSTSSCKSSPCQSTSSCKSSPCQSTSSCKSSPCQSTSSCKSSPCQSTSSCKSSPCHSTSSCKSSGSRSVSQASAPPFLVRFRHGALRITGRALTFSFQGEALLSQLQVIGGNKTGVFVHQVTEGSSAHTTGIRPGAQILEVKCERNQRALRMVLEDSTMEEALWALGQVQGPCSFSLRPKQDAYENLLQQLKKGEVTSGDSFYVRVNMSLTGGVAGALSVTCNDILHVTDTHHGQDGHWWASHVHSCQLMDLKSGSLPNYYRAQMLLIRAIEDMSFQQRTHRKVERAQAQGKQKAVRIVSTGRQGRNPLWVSVEEDSDSKTKPTNDGSTPRSCVTLMPYTLVTPHYPPVCRPVLLLPTILGRILHKRLAEQEGYQLCEPETLSATEHASRVQKGEVLEECDSNTHSCYTVQGVEKIMTRGTHCVLPLGLDCVRRLHRAEIFPIIIFVQSTERSTRKLKHKLRQSFITEAQLLECSRSEEPLLDKLPCLYRTVPPESWSDSTSLLDTLQYVVGDEQRKIVWVEPDLW